MKDLLSNADIYYQVGDRKTYSKNESILLAGGDFSKIHFYQQDHIWDNVDFTVEPAQSIDFLLEENCRLYREKYDHICLWLSSGYDSQTALQSFIKAGVIVDEISYMDRTEYYNDTEVPFIEASIRDYQLYHNPKVKITPVDLNLKYHENIYKRLKEDNIWNNGPGSNLRYSRTTASYIHNFHDDLLRTKANQHKRVDIYGKDKPRLDFVDGKWYLQMNDHVFIDTIGAPVECFYCNGQLPELHIKQTHMAVRYFESLPNLTHELLHKIQSNDPLYYRDWNLGIGRKPIPNPTCINGDTKVMFANNLGSRDASKLIEHIKKTTNAVKRVEGAHNDLLRQLPDSVNLTQTLIAKKRFIKNKL